MRPVLLFQGAMKPWGNRDKFTTSRRISAFFDVVFRIYGHRTRSDKARSEARVRESQSRHFRLPMDVALEARQAYLALKDTDGRLSVSAKALTQVDQSQREIEDRSKDQKAIITQLIDAQLAATGVRDRRDNAAADVQLARPGLQRVVGLSEEMLKQ